MLRRLAFTFPKGRERDLSIHDGVLGKSVGTHRSMAGE
jgi:hypothetical protein